MEKLAGPDIFQAIEEALPSYREQHPEYRDVLELFEGLETLKKEFIRRADVRLPKGIDAKGLFEEGFPVLPRSDFPLDLDSAGELFTRLIAGMASHNETLAGACEKIRLGVEERGLVFETLAGEFLREGFEAIGKAADEAGADPWVLRVFIKGALDPSIAAAREMVLALLPEEGWDESFCPVCGSRPAVGLHSRAGEGSRNALCSFCGHTWRITRIGCAFCSTQDQKKIRYFHAEDDDARRVYMCDECKSYLKVFEEDELPVWLNPILEDLVTAHLDDAAEREGYTRPAPRFLGI